MPESAAAMARQHDLNDKTFRRAMRAEGFPWHQHWTRWNPPEGSPEHQDMLRVAMRLVGEKQEKDLR